MMFNQGGFDPNAQQWAQQKQPQAQQFQQMIPTELPNEANDEETDNSRRPPNAFILYSQAMRTQVRQENPSLSNTECSRLLGKMWKEVPNEIKLQYKQKAAALQEEFKREHPDYTYRKARRKRALNELLTKSPAAFAPVPGGQPGFPDMSQWQMGQPGAMMGMPNFQFGMMGQGAQQQQTQQDSSIPQTQQQIGLTGFPIGMGGAQGMQQQQQPQQQNQAQFQPQSQMVRNFGGQPMNSMFSFNQGK